MSQRAWGIFLLVAAFVILAFVAYKNSTRRQVPIVFSPRNELQSIWEQYKRDYIEPETFRVLDKQKENITTSEGQSYAMLRAVWLDDKETFDNVWQWTKDNLQREDKLFSWLFGQTPDGSYGILTNQGGQNSATDADVDIALALIFASGRWNQAEYLGDAHVIIDAIWEHEVVTIKGRPYLVANNVEKDAPQTMVINPSYYAPYAYKIFGQIDDHNWNGVVETSYEVLDRSLASTFDKPTSAYIPPDWVFIDKSTGAILPPTGNSLTSTTSFDALRVPWRLYLDWLWFADERAKLTLQKMTFFSTEWEDKGLLYTSYAHNGAPAMNNQSAAFYGGTLGYFMMADPENAKEIYENKLQVLFNPDSNTWKIQLGYYDDNWAWFGIAMYNNMLPNLAVTQ
jgi:endoglucanase